MNVSSSISPWRKRVDSVSKSSNSRSRIGITYPGTSSRTSGFSSEPTRARARLSVLLVSIDAGSIWPDSFGGVAYEPRNVPKGNRVIAFFDSVQRIPRATRLPRGFAQRRWMAIHPPWRYVDGQSSRRARGAWRLGDRSRGGGGARRGIRSTVNRRLVPPRRRRWGPRPAGGGRRYGERELVPAHVQQAGESLPLDQALRP